MNHMELRSATPPKTAAEKEWDRRAIVLVWSTLDEDLRPDLDCEIDVVPPEWFEFEMSEFGLDALMAVDSWEQWAMENGFAGGQRVLLRFWPPVVSRDYWGEWDVDYQYEIAGFEPMPAADAATFWEAWLNRDSAPETFRKLTDPAPQWVDYVEDDQHGDPNDSALTPDELVVT